MRFVSKSALSAMSRPTRFATRAANNEVGASGARGNAHAGCGVQEIALGDRLLLVCEFSDCASDGCPCLFGKVMPDVGHDQGA